MLGLSSAKTGIAQAPTIQDFSAGNIIIEANTLKAIKGYSKWLLLAEEKEKLGWKQYLNELSVKNPLLGCLINEESSGEHYNKDGTIKRGKHGEFGLGQFMKRTFYRFADEMGFYGADVENPIHQLIVMNWALERGYSWHWTTLPKCR